ncbi:hypothetical protein B0H65DRAFT_23275 [Neurospora tetraspora]|uniref:Uncharacterized protein n=1 Tax=Neurospora tetraspora TaxID=94610 RepID=A0AAE0MVS6_9PEZI|nr:hypothetical protein B0H65DRAFT_23275 [Neurospora tetraspora]
MKSTALFTTVTMAHMALCVPVPWMAGDKILPLLNKDAPNSATSGRSPKTDNTFALASSHLAPGPILQKAEQSFNSLWDNWKKKHGSSPALNVDDAKKDIPVLIITEMGELSVAIPSSSQPLSKQASNSKQKPVSIPPGNKKADNVSVTELGELSIGIPSPVPSPPPSSSTSLPSSSRPSNGTSPCPFYVGKPRDHDDVLIIFLVSTFLLVVVVVEAWDPVCRSVRNRFSSRRKGAIRLVEETETKPKSFRNDSVLVKSESG